VTGMIQSDLLGLVVLVVVLAVAWLFVRHVAKEPPAAKGTSKPRTWRMGVHIGPLFFWW
jgi:hypothetical protein